MTNRFTKTSFFVQGGIMRPPSDGGLKLKKGKYVYRNPNYRTTVYYLHVKFVAIVSLFFSHST